ncbi:MAG: hypothetical protein ABSG21_19110, partial [Spirochaetia bacterium]
MKSAHRRIRLRERSASSIALNATLLVLVGVTVAGFFLLDTKHLDVARAGARLFKDMGGMMTHPAAQHFTVGEALKSILVTLCLGFLTTFLGAVLALV